MERRPPDRVSAAAAVAAAPRPDDCPPRCRFQSLDCCRAAAARTAATRKPVPGIVQTKCELSCPTISPVFSKGSFTHLGANIDISFDQTWDLGL